MAAFKTLAYKEILTRKTYKTFLDGIDIRAKSRFLTCLWAFLAPSYVAVNSSDGNSKIYIQDFDGGHEENITAIFVLGSNDLETPSHAAEVYHNLVRKNPDIKIIIAGKGGHATVPAPIFSEAEAVRYRAELIKRGVNPDAIIIDDTSENSGANILNSYIKLSLLYGESYLQQRLNFVIVQSPMAQLRANLTFEKQWKGNWGFYISSPPQLTGLESQENIDFHLTYALRELTTLIAYMYGQTKFVTEYDIPEDLIDLIIQLFSEFKNLNLDFSSFEEKIHFILNFIVKFYRDIFKDLETDFLSSIEPA